MGVLDDDRTGGETALDAGLQAAFDPRAASVGGVHEVVERLTGSPGFVSLRPPEGSEAPILGMSSPELPSRAFGRVSYQLLGEIARGGMGVVVRGHDPDLGRDVAVKILHRELSNRPEIVRRFVEEAQIGGQLQHPGIVPVYELGLTADERPYFTMKLVNGRTLAALLAERRDKDADRRRHLGVFEAVCQTLAYAHSRGVIHRDLKPANVMVGAFGEVQVVDWGLAKVLHHGGVADEQRAQASHAARIATVRSGPKKSTTESAAGAVMGTPAYMSPEQARGDVEQLDERSDVFGLGAILCEILTGAPPYPGRYELALTHAGRGEMSDLLARLDACGADADLVLLCRDCLRPVPADRPRNAQVLGERLHAYLMSVEERARRAQVESARTQVRLEAERKARKLTLALTLSVLAGVGGYAWMARQRDAARRDNEQRVLAALSEAAIASSKVDWASARSAIERARALAQANTTSAELCARVESEGEIIAFEASAAERKLALDRDNAALVADLENIRQPEGDRIYPRDWARLSQSYRSVLARHGLAPDDLGESEAAAQLRSRGIDAVLATFLDEWAFVRSNANEDDESSRLVRITSRIDPDPVRQRLRTGEFSRASLLETSSQIDVAKQPAPTLRLLAGALRSVDAEPEQVEFLRRARRVHPRDFPLAMNLARALLRVEPIQPGEALRHYEAALAIRPDSVEAWHELGQALEQLGNDAAALEHFRAAAVHFPGDGHLYFHFGQNLWKAGQTVEAATAYRHSIELEPDYAMAHNNLGSVLDDLGRADEALDEYRRAVELEPESGMFHSNLGCALNATGKLESAIAELNRAIELDPNSGLPLAELASVHLKQAHPEEAESALRRAIELDPNSASFRRELGVLLLNAGRLHESLTELEHVVELDPTSGFPLADFATVHLKLGHFEEAEAALRRAIELEPTSASFLLALGNVFYMAGRFEEALEEYEHAVELEPSSAINVHWLGNTLERLGRLEEGLAARRRATELDPTNATLHFNLSVALTLRRQPEEALAELYRTIELDPNYAEAHNNLGQQLAALGRLDEAIRENRRAVEIDPEDARHHFGLAHALRQNGQADEAIAEFRRAAELETHDAQFHADLASVFQLLGQPNDAIVEWRRALEIEPSHHDSHVFLAWVLATTDREELRDPKQAVVHARNAVGLTPEDANDWENLGVALFVAGQHAEALHSFERAVELGRTDEGATGLFLALCHHRLGDSQMAKSWLDRAEPGIDKLLTAEPALLRFATEVRNAVGREE
jgi:serine/threonine-protein kinase